MMLGQSVVHIQLRKKCVVQQPTWLSEISLIRQAVCCEKRENGDTDRHLLQHKQCKTMRMCCISCVEKQHDDILCSGHAALHQCHQRKQSVVLEGPILGAFHHPPREEAHTRHDDNPSSQDEKLSNR